MDFGPPKKEHHYYPYKKLYRSRSDKWVGGVCGGLAQYFKIDPVLVRLSWVIITLFTMGAGIIGYILFWIFVDKEPRQYKQVSEHVTYDDYGRKHVHHYYDKVH
ncbi:MAG: PspC domain-containing protein [Thermoplasmata archaeon]|nr:MAG: PspC domain-containing protein [Thermoplasmata archaeon]